MTDCRLKGISINCRLIGIMTSQEVSSDGSKLARCSGLQMVLNKVTGHLCLRPTLANLASMLWELCEFCGTVKRRPKYGDGSQMFSRV